MLIERRRRVFIATKSVVYALTLVEDDGVGRCFLEIRWRLSCRMATKSYSSLCMTSMVLNSKNSLDTRFEPDIANLSTSCCLTGMQHNYDVFELLYENDPSKTYFILHLQ